MCAVPAATVTAPPRPADLTTRAEIHDLVVAFYREIVFDDLLAPVFGEVAEVDWAEHIPKLVDYWCRVLLGEVGYAGHLLDAHRHVHRQAPFAPGHFDRWYGLWVDTVRAGWSGPVADRAVQHSARIATVLAHRLAVDWSPPAEVR
jgi:hemoglobin